MQFGSKAGAYQVLVRPKRDKWNHDGTVLLDTVPPLTAEFGKWGAEFRFQNDLTGAVDTTADLRGHFFDTEIAQDELGWTDEEREMVEKVLLRLCQEQPDMVWIHKEATVDAPWPTYDTTHHNQVSVLAEQLGLVDQALAYERQNKNRDTVVGKLEEAISRRDAAEALVAD